MDSNSVFERFLVAEKKEGEVRVKEVEFKGTLKECYSHLNLKDNPNWMHLLPLLPGESADNYI